MKFSNGEWLVRDGFDVKYAANVYTAKIEPKKLTLYCSYNFPIFETGMTLDGGIMTIEVTSPRRDIISTRIVNYKEDRSHCPTFPLNTNDPDVDIEENDEAWTFTSGHTSLKVSKGKKHDFRFYYDGKPLTGAGFRSKALVTDPDGAAYISEQLDMGVGEKIYGLGERFTNFVKNGQSVDVWNADGGTATDQAYKNVPFYMSNRNYGVFVDSPGKVSFEIGSDRVQRVQFSLEGQEMTYCVIGGSSMKDVLNTYTDLTGKAPLVPEWSYGLWLSTSFTTDYDEETVMKFVDGMAERHIPLSVFHFDCRWMKELEWCNFEWDPDKFPDPEGLLKKLHDRGIKVCVWINPYIGQKSPLFEEGAKGGYFIKRTNGQVWQWDKWQAGMAIVDFTNPEAVKWYQSKLRHLMDQGVDCFKTDFGERIPVKDVVYFDGSDPKLMHNYYAQLYNKAVYDLICEQKGEENAILFARSATVGGQQYPVHWGGDNSSNYPSMAESLRAGLSFGMSGFGYWSHDIAGFEDKPTPDLYKRWTQFGLLSSHSRYHGSREYKVPWLYGDEAVDVAREFTELKQRLVPYLVRMSHETHETGVPMMRSMVLEFQDDPTCEDIDTQYMLGDDILVAPVFSEDGAARFYVPDAGGEHAGEPWKNLITGESYEPGRWYRQTYDYHTLPVLVRPGADPLNEQE
ncbi:alpha-xylosidase [Bifidobacterium sp. ESL0764]|uniref:alpha-xylosidase n=1 Tax=Bifidobacterium sp. ESL0764 TaxID=2983228 RepID=UPI0023F74572|nr:alpha-xylosidase [Bifidobacterium sp. ESL0764]WEV66233.1 alpha-xylosidase [Bifidobacterium sp. ESL0764]